jgi:hypothetical protein
MRTEIHAVSDLLAGLEILFLPPAAEVFVRQHDRP